MVEMDTLAEKMFSLLKGNGLKIKIFDVDGNEVTDPSMGRRFFISNPNIMVTIDEDSNNVEFSKGANVDDESIKKVENGIKRLANEFQMDSSLKVFGKSIQPRDYSYQAKIQKEPAMMENKNRTLESKSTNPHSIEDEAFTYFEDCVERGFGYPEALYQTIIMMKHTHSLVSADVVWLRKSIIKHYTEEESLPTNNDEEDAQMLGSTTHYMESKMTENTMKPVNHQLLGKVLHRLRFFKQAAAYTLADDIGVEMHEIQPVLNRLVTDGKIQAEQDPHGDMIYSISVEEAVMETSTEKLAKYKTAAAADASKADKEGNFKRGDKRFSGIVKATKKQFANDEKKSDIKESFSKMFGSALTSQQTLENVRILVRHKVPVSEEVRGSRSRHISSIFLECNGERMRFQHNYLPGARAMAQHMAHGGSMTDKVGTYISESTGNLLKLQSFNRYVTTNKLINEDSSGIIETVKENIETIRAELKKLTGVKTYETAKARLETFEREALAEDDTSGLKDLFTIRRFDEKFEEVLPIVKQLVQEKDTYHKRIEEAAGNVITLRREAINTTPMFEFAGENARLGFKINELALRIMENDE